MQNDPGFECEVDASRADSGFETLPDSPLIKLMEKLTGIESGTVAFGTEAAQMMTLGSEAVVIGPGDIREAHRTGEFVPVAELERCAEILKNAIDDYFNRTERGSAGSLMRQAARRMRSNGAPWQLRVTKSIGKKHAPHYKLSLALYVFCVSSVGAGNSTTHEPGIGKSALQTPRDPDMRDEIVELIRKRASVFR